jgi:molybdopterin synthase catalytic subunit
MTTTPLHASPEVALRIDITDRPLPVAEMTAWVTLPECGAVVTFTGTVREYSVPAGGSRVGQVTAIDYEAFAGHAVTRMREVAEAALDRWPQTRRIALIHRTGLVATGEAAVLVAVSAGHRVQAFLAAQFCIDVLKAAVPVWKLEHRHEQESWVETGNLITDVAAAAEQWEPYT